MRLLIASDIHGSASSAFLFSEKVKEINPDMVVLLGDILYHGPRNPLPDQYDPKEVISILTAIKNPIIAIQGNCDADVDQLVLPWHLAESSWIMADGNLILAVHGHRLPDDDKDIKISPGAVILSGHTHIPTAENKGFIRRWNPGSVSLPKNNYKKSFGLYENGKFSVMTFDGQEIMCDII